MRNGVDYIDGRLVRFLATDKLRLQGFLAGRNRSGKCMIFVHGMGGNFYSNRISREVAAAVNKKGFDIFAINTRGHDVESSSHTVNGKKSKRVMIGTRYEKFEESWQDIKGAINVMRKLGYKKFVLCGHSTGCQKVLYYQYKTSDKSVKALVLLAPDDDYNLNKKELGANWNDVVKRAKQLMRSKKPNGYVAGAQFSAQRFLSIADLKRVESRLFNYDGELAEFRKVKIPVFVAFGTADEGAVKPVGEYIKILEENTMSSRFCGLVIEGANHSFVDHEATVAKCVANWITET